MCYKPVILDARLLVAIEAHEGSQAKFGSHESMTFRNFGSRRPQRWLMLMEDSCDNSATTILVFCTVMLVPDDGGENPMAGSGSKTLCERKKSSLRNRAEWKEIIRAEK